MIDYHIYTFEKHIWFENSKIQGAADNECNLLFQLEKETNPAVILLSKAIIIETMTHII